ncbi:hypothetical protein AC578_8368 [Pseudocercospora eumusae]|uniref:Uncharacterized protein n=1 Tax=Pseudocercospora eumusae TaxID=321146 RepID=A0A139HS35_9PEZI|nr:hypothetical protein AC578_8368 [Pseudocercospora eumusae]
MFSNLCIDCSALGDTYRCFGSGTDTFIQELGILLCACLVDADTLRSQVKWVTGALRSERIANVVDPKTSIQAMLLDKTLPFAIIEEGQTGAMPKYDSTISCMPLPLLVLEALKDMPNEGLNASVQIVIKMKVKVKVVLDAEINHPFDIAMHLISIIFDVRSAANYSDILIRCGCLHQSSNNGAVPIILSSREERQLSKSAKLYMARHVLCPLLKLDACIKALFLDTCINFDEASHVTYTSPYAFLNDALSSLNEIGMLKLCFRFTGERHGFLEVSLLDLEMGIFRMR